MPLSLRNAVMQVFSALRRNTPFNSHVARRRQAGVVVKGAWGAAQRLLSGVGAEVLRSIEQLARPWLMQAIGGLRS